MRPLARIVLALSMGFASEKLFAQDPAPTGGEPSAPAAAVEDAAPAPEATITAPADPPPSDETAADTPAFAALLAAGDGAPEAMTPTPGPPPASQNTDRAEPPLPPPPAPGVEVALGSVDDVPLGPSGKKSDWFFLAVLAGAAGVIATKLLHTRSERVSIHEDRRLGGGLT